MQFIEAGARRTQNEQWKIDFELCQIFHKFKRTSIRPVNVIEQKNNRSIQRDFGKELRDVIESTVTDLTRIIANAAHIRAFRKIETQQFTDKDRVFLTPIADQRRHALHQLCPCLSLRVTIHNLESLTKHIPQQTIRQALRLLIRTTFEHIKVVGVCINPAFKFVNQTTLAKPSISFDNEYCYAAIENALLECRLNDLEFRFAPDHSGGYTFDTSSPQPKRPRPHSLNHIRLQRLTFPFDGNRCLDLHIEHATHELIRIMRNQNLICLRRFHKTTRRIDCISHGGKFAMRAHSAQ